MSPANHSGQDSEHAIQVGIVQWWHTVGVARYGGLPRLLAIPNGGRRDAVTGARLRAEGVLPGVPDLFLPRLCHGCGGLWLEVKTEAGRVSAAQEACLHALHNEGYAVAVVRSVDEAVTAIDDYHRCGQLLSWDAVQQTFRPRRSR